MDSDFLLKVVFRWMHILAAVVAVGGTIFLRFVLMPSADAALTAEQHATLRERLMRRWKIVIMVCIAALLVSGVYNFIAISLVKAPHSAVYHPLFGIKFLAAMGVFFIASVLTGRAAGFAALRERRRTWLAVAAGLGILVILISGVLKNLPTGP